MTVKRPSLVGATVDELIQLIETHQLRAGDSLPSTAELAERLDVSRTVVREAIAELAGQGLLVRRQGKDTTIAFPGGRELERLLRLRKALRAPDQHDLTHWRSTLLVAAAGLAAKEATLDDATALGSRASSARQAKSGEACVAVEELFLASVARFSRNEMILLSIEGSAALVRAEQAQLWNDARRNRPHVEALWAGLDRISTAIEMRDPEGAQEAMAEYLELASTQAAKPLAAERS